MEQKICQCCAMPIDESTFGTEADGSKNEEYCHYCYADGKFTKDCTMDEMIEHNLKYLDEFNKDSEVKYSVEEARATMKEFFPQLKRWKNKQEQHKGLYKKGDIIRRIHSDYLFYTALSIFSKKSSSVITPNYNKLYLPIKLSANRQQSLFIFSFLSFIISSHSLFYYTFVTECPFIRTVNQ